jgi:putative ABC transport system substrate-binding protein
MKRREFIRLFGSAAAAWPLSAQAQQPATRPTIGFLVGGTPSSDRQWIAAFVQRLSELGWVEGSTVHIEYRSAAGRYERYTEIAAEFVRMRVDVIVTSGAAAVGAAKQATSVIPIVFAAVGDPVGGGLVASLARPGGNLTGLSLQFTDISGKRVEFLRTILPGLRRLGILSNASSPSAVLEMHEAQATARTLGLEVVTPPIQRPEDIELAFEAFKDRVEALYVVFDPLVNTNRVRISNLALAARMPTLGGGRELVEAGCLISYGPNIPDMFRRSAEPVDKILRGAKPADIPVEQPTKFDLVINLKTAKAIGLTMPPSLLATADEVIE